MPNQTQTNVAQMIASLSYGPMLSQYNPVTGTTAAAEKQKPKQKEITKKDMIKKKVAFESVILPEKIVDQIKAAISQEEYQSLIFEKWGFGEIFEKGTAISLLFHGVPGTGKTLMAQAIADYYGQDLRILGPADIETSEPGGAERTIRKIFQIATSRILLKRGYAESEVSEVLGVDISDDPAEIQNPMTGEITKIPPDQRYHGKPQTLLFDECDSLLVDRSAVGHIMGAQVSALLTELERFEGVIIFTTNRIGILDPAMERRITAIIEFPFPDKTTRLSIWKRMIPKQAPLDESVNLEKLAEFPMPGGNIKNAVLNAARAAAYGKQDKITQDNFVQAINKELEGIQQFASSSEHDRKIQGQSLLGQSFERVRGLTKGFNAKK